MSKKYKFPEGFLWGSATSAHQIEGENKNDWSEWERKKSEKLARDAKMYWQKWQVEKFPEMLYAENYLSSKASGHYEKYEEDFDVLESLNQKAFRLSIEWSRIEPKKGEFNEKEIEHYKNVLLSLRKRNIKSFVTLYHWPLPLWFRDEGGWESKKAREYFKNYCEKLVYELNELVDFWITINEPEIYAGHAYFSAQWPPQKKSIFKYLKVTNTLAKAHIDVFLSIKKINKDAKVGISKHNIFFEAYKNKPINLFLKKLADCFWNFYFLNKIKKYQDFIGLNHYSHNRIDYGFNKNENKRVSDMGWELYPKSIYYVLLDLKKYDVPIYITENGLADKYDENREWFIKESLRYVYKAIKEGVDVRAYLYWSLLDNFEWDKGFWPRFGLVEVDYKTLKRRVRPSALKYAEICKKNELEI